MMPLPDRASQDSDVRPSLTDGILFPGEREQLEEEVERLLEEARQSRTAPPHSEGEVLTGAMVPHAAYDLTGRSIADALLPLRRGTGFAAPPQCAVLIAPVHREHFPGCALPSFRSLHTPLGEVEVDTEAVELLLRKGKDLQRDDLPFWEEHALELPLPFLQRLAPGLPVLPILTGDNSARTERSVSSVLNVLQEGPSRYGGRTLDSTFVLISGNLTGYVDTARGAAHRDRFLQLIESGAAREIGAARQNHEISACASAACAAVLRCTAGRALRLGETFLQRPENGGREVHYGSLLLLRPVSSPG
jgi:AmmeMemoRadiSam system protein B